MKGLTEEKGAEVMGGIGLVLIGLVLGAIIGFAMGAHHQKREQKDLLGLLVAEDPNELEAQVLALETRVDSLETDIEVTDQSVGVVWETVNDLDDHTKKALDYCCEEYPWDHVPERSLP